MESKRSAGQKSHHGSLDVAFWLRPEQLAGSTSRAGAEAAHRKRRAFAPAERAGEVLHAVASAVCEIPFGDVQGTAVRRITELTVEADASLEPPIEVRARTVGVRELPAGRHLVVIHCELTNQFGDCIAAFAVETEAKAEGPAGGTRPGSTSDSFAGIDPDLECIDNIPV
jgi:hypothetical protein